MAAIAMALHLRAKNRLVSNPRFSLLFSSSNYNEEPQDGLTSSQSQSEPNSSSSLLSSYFSGIKPKPREQSEQQPQWKQPYPDPKAVAYKELRKKISEMHPWRSSITDQKLREALELSRSGESAGPPSFNSVRGSLNPNSDKRTARAPSVTFVGTNSLPSSSSSSSSSVFEKEMTGQKTTEFMNDPFGEKMKKDMESSGMRTPSLSDYAVKELQMKYIRNKKKEERTKLLSDIERYGRKEDIIALSKLKNSFREKVLVDFDSATGKPICEKRKLWERHLGAMVKNDDILPHCTESWEKLAPSTLNALWDAVLDKFETENEKEIKSYRDVTLKDMKVLWENWRHRLYVKYIKPCDGDVTKIRANCPPIINQANWEWLLDHYYLSESYQDKSATNAKNKKKLKQTEMRSLQEDEVFEAESPDTGLGMEPEPVLASSVEGESDSKGQLGEQNMDLKKKVDQLTKKQQDSDARIAKIEAQRLEDVARFEATNKRFEKQIQAMMTSSQMPGSSRQFHRHNEDEETDDESAEDEDY